MFMFGDWVLRPFLLVSTVLKFAVFHLCNEKVNDISLPFTGI